MLTVEDVRVDGRRERVAVGLVDTEREATSDPLFRTLEERGLHGVHLVTRDDHRGLVAATRRDVQGATWPWWYVLALRNAGGKVAKKYRGDPTRDLEAVCAVPDWAWALHLARDVVVR